MKVREANEQRVRHEAKKRKRLRPRPFASHDFKLSSHSQMDAFK
jgi:hypothetical protein